MSTAHGESGRQNLTPHRGSIPAIAVALVLGIAARSFGTEPGPAVNAPNGLPWLQTFSNDFTSANAQSNLNHWSAENGTGSQYGLNGWGNNEWEYYNNATTGGNLTNNNLYINANGLNLTAIVPSGTISVPNNASGITATTVSSARINSQNYFSQTYGLFQWTASSPSGSGVWPALWMMPRDSAYGGWPRSGEIDVFEAGGSGLTANKQEQGSYHTGPSYDISATQVYGPSGYDTRNTNTYNLLWLPAGATFNGTTYPHGVLAWYVNGTLFETRTGSNPGTNSTGWYNPSNGATQAGPFDKPFYFIMNMAIGGQYPGYNTPNSRPPLAAGSYTITISDVQAFSIPILGDLNRDGHLDTKDISAMQSALTDQSAFANSHALSVSNVSLIGDMNADGRFTNADMQKLLNVLKSGGGSTSSIPEPSSLVLLALGALTVWRRKMIDRPVSSKTPAL